MKTVPIEKAAIARALGEQPNMDAAAEALGASRRTLQARMRDYGMPPGDPGRPRHLLGLSERTGGSQSDFPAVLGVLGLLGGLVFVVKRSDASDVSGLRGLDLIVTAPR